MAMALATRGIGDFQVVEIEAVDPWADARAQKRLSATDGFRLAPDPAWLPWREVAKLRHYWLEVEAMAKPMEMRESLGRYRREESTRPCGPLPP